MKKKKPRSSLGSQPLKTNSQNIASRTVLKKQAVSNSKTTKKSRARDQASTSIVDNKKQRSQASLPVKHATVREPVHVLIRMRSENGQTISEHYRILQSEGRVLIGKVGRPLGPEFMAELNKQSQGGSPTFLFLAMKEGWRNNYLTYQCELEAVLSSLPQEKEHFVPDYYSDQYDAISTWFEVTSMYELEIAEMNRIQVVSSQRSMLSVLRSMASVFRVRVTES